MAFGIDRKELRTWQKKVLAGEIAFLTHYWLDERFPESTCVTKVGCSDLEKLIQWGESYQLKKEWIDMDPKYPHYDLFGSIQKEILEKEGQIDQIIRFNL